jgi:hypothetical protein
LRKAVNEIAAGGCYAEGLPAIEIPEDDVTESESSTDVEVTAEESATSPA